MNKEKVGKISARLALVAFAVLWTVLFILGMMAIMKNG